MPKSQKYTQLDTLKALYTIATKSNIFSLILSLIVMFFCVVKEIERVVINVDSSADYYENISAVLFFISYCALFYGLLLPLIKVRKYPYGRLISNIGWCVMCVLLIITITLVINRTNAFDNFRDALQGTLGVVAAIAVVTGWIVNHQIAATNNRVNHTLNLLLQTRISSVYQEHEQNIRAVYERNAVIPKEDIKDWLNHRFEVQDDAKCQIQQCTGKDKLMTKKDKVHKAIASQCYILNYYEFLAVGINSGLLDEELLYQTIGGMLIRQVHCSSNVVSAFQSSGKKSLEHLTRLEEKWRPRHERESEIEQSAVNN